MELKSAVVGLAALGGVMLAAGSASAAMPNGLPHADQISRQTADVEQVRWVCNAWGRCWWRPGPRWYGAYGAWGPRPVWRPGWRGAYAWGGPVWRPRPVWGPRPGWGPRSGWGWNGRW
ncbi:hypothetical protein V1278_001314 [Bradyrhizobium sp. AZCC 1577]